MPTPIEQALATYRSDWATVQLGATDCASVNPEVLAETTDSDFRFRYVDISSVNRGAIDWKAVQSLRFADAPSRARRILRSEDVMLCTVRPMLGSHAHLAPDSAEPFVCSTGFAVIRSSVGLNPRFLRHMPFAEQVSRQLVAWQCGTNYPAVNERDVRCLAIPVPKPDEQAAIARVLDAVDSAIERTREAIESESRLQDALLTDSFDRLQAQPRKLREFTTDVRYGTSKASSDRGWGNPVLRIPNVVGDQLTLDDLAFVQLPPADVERLALTDGDLLLVRTNGNPHYVGRSAVFRGPDDRTWVYASYLIRVRLTADLLPDYVNIFLGVERGRRELLRRVTTSAGNHNINSNSIRLLTIPVPDNKDAQQEVIDLARACRAKTGALVLNLQALVKLKKSLLHDLLTGAKRLDPKRILEAAPE